MEGIIQQYALRLRRVVVKWYNFCFREFRKRILVLLTLQELSTERAIVNLPLHWVFNLESSTISNLIDN